MSNARNLANIASLENKMNQAAILAVNTTSTDEFERLRGEIITYGFEMNRLSLGSSFKDFGFNLEIVKTVDACLKRYKPEAGEFVNYYRYSLSKRMLNTKCADYEYLSSIVYLKDSTDGEDLTAEDKLDFLNHKSEEDSDYGDGYYAMVDRYNVQAILVAIDKAYNKQQNRAKPFFATFVTGLVYECLDKDIVSLDELKEYSFFDSASFDEYLKRRKVFSQKELGEKFDRQASNVSRSISDLKAAIRREYYDDAA